MRQFLKYELKNNWKSFLTTYCLIFGSFVILSIFILCFQHMPEPTTVLAIIYAHIMLLIYGSIIVSAVLYVINVVKTLYTSIFTDEGYLTLSFPKSTDSLILSKILANIIWGTFYLISVLCGTFLLMLVLDAPINTLFADLFKTIQQVKGLVTVIPFALLNTFVQAVLSLMLLLLSFAIVNSGVAKNAKLIFGLLLYLGMNYAIVLVKMLSSYLSFGFALNTNGEIIFTAGRSAVSGILFFFDIAGASNNNILYVFDITSFIISLGLLVGAYFFTRKLIEKHLELN